jgi:DNA-binding transcriptional LysR family regulator
MSPALRISIVPGVTPGKWVRTWEQRRPRDPVTVTLLEPGAQLDLLSEGEVELAFVRLPVDGAGLHLIPLYSELPVAVVPRDHAAAELDSIAAAEVADELLDLPELTAKQAVEVVAGGAGVVVLPMSVARLYHRKDVAAVPVTDRPETQVGVAWRAGDADPRTEEFIGVVRGRTSRSSRGSGADEEPRPKLKAAQKAAAKAARRAQAAGDRKPAPGRPSRRRP